MSVFLRFRLALAGFGPDAAGEMAQKPCVGWNTESFFESATAADVSRCVAAGADMGARDDDDRTPLHLAAANSESLPVVRALPEAGADPEARDGREATPLHWATLSEIPSVVAALLEAGADPEALDKNGLDAAHWAMTNGRLPFEATGLLSAHEFPYVFPYAKDADDTSP